MHFLAISLADALAVFLSISLLVFVPAFLDIDLAVAVAACSLLPSCVVLISALLQLWNTYYFDSMLRYYNILNLYVGTKCVVLIVLYLTQDNIINT